MLSYQIASQRLLKIWKQRKGLILPTLALLTLLGIFITNCSRLSPASPPNFQHSLHSHILVDQFGYRPKDSKIAVITQPNAVSNPSEISDAYQSLFDLYQVIDVNSNTNVYEAKAHIWQSEKISQQSGDRASWFDFSMIQNPGTYIVRNSRTGDESVKFEIAEDIYNKILVAATRMFFYQRSGFPKEIPYADARWVDGAAFVGFGQDTEASFIDDKTNPALTRDMHGGWFDAGDTNKYVTFAVEAIHQLLDAYTQNPAIWTDDFNIPESNNGIPDLLDELNFELDWLQRMQDDDGGVFIKVGTTDFNAASRPSLDRRPRFYGSKCSSSTIALASMFSHAALVFRDIPELSPMANVFQEKAINAWNWFHRNPLQIDCDSQEIKSGDADLSEEVQIDIAVSSAIYLFSLTGEPVYEDYIINHYKQTRQIKELSLWSIYQAYVGDALLLYTSLKLASLDTKQDILRSFSTMLKNHPELYGGGGLAIDPYRAYMPDEQYHWGSNSIKSKLGNANYDAFVYDKSDDDSGDYISQALDFLHYIHGVNPLGIVYLTNMYEYGAEQSANEMYHEWFGGGDYKNALTSLIGPAPGYVTGGPNRNYTGSSPINKLPPMKVYLDSSEGSKKMWEITEPAIYYQSAYIKLLSKFCS